MRLRKKFDALLTALNAYCDSTGVVLPPRLTPEGAEHQARRFTTLTTCINELRYKLDDIERKHATDRAQTNIRLDSLAQCVEGLLVREGTRESDLRAVTKALASLDKQLGDLQGDMVMCKAREGFHLEESTRHRRKFLALLSFLGLKMSLPTRGTDAYTFCRIKKARRAS
jgi:hypothetical protein